MQKWVEHMTQVLMGMGKTSFLDKPNTQDEKKVGYQCSQPFTLSHSVKFIRGEQANNRNRSNH